LTNVGYYTIAQINERISEFISYKLYYKGAEVYSDFVLVVDVRDGLDASTYKPIQVNELSVTLKSESATKKYDEKPLTAEGVYISMGSLAEGDVLHAKASGSVTDPTSTPVSNVIKSEDVVILNKDGIDVTSNYDITLAFGKLYVYE
jgi:hypothetical protein